MPAAVRPSTFPGLAGFVRISGIERLSIDASSSLLELVEEACEIAVNPGLGKPRPRDGIQFVGLHGDGAMGRRDSCVMTGMDTAQCPARKDVTAAAEQQILMKVQWVERRDHLPPIGLDIRQWQRRVQTSRPTHTVWREAGKIAVHVTRVQCGDGSTDEILT